MRQVKRNHLVAAGWRVGSTTDFLGLSEVETAIVELRLRLSGALRARRMAAGLSQIALATRIGSSQSRVAKMEAGDPTVSLDLLVRSLVSLGARPRELAAAIGRQVAEPAR